MRHSPLLQSNTIRADQRGERVLETVQRTPTLPKGSRWGEFPKGLLQGFLGRRLIRGKEHSSPLEPAPCIAATGHFVPGAVQVIALCWPLFIHAITIALHPLLIPTIDADVPPKQPGK